MYSKTIMLGRIAIAPELKTTPDGIKLARFRIAVDRTYIGKSGKRLVDFFDVIAWRGLGEFASKYFTKGKPILVDGRFENRAYEDKDGKKHYCTELVAESISFAGDARPNSGDNRPADKTSGAPVNVDVDAPEDYGDLPDDAEDLPF